MSRSLHLELVRDSDSRKPAYILSLADIVVPVSVCDQVGISIIETSIIKTVSQRRMTWSLGRQLPIQASEMCAQDGGSSRGAPYRYLPAPYAIVAIICYASYEYSVPSECLSMWGVELVTIIYIGL